MAYARFALSLALAVLLAGCGDTPGGAVVEALAESVAPDRTPPVTRAEAMALPFASALVTLGGRRPAFVVLHSTQGGRQIWLTADRVAIATDQGRVVSVAGLPGAISETRFRDGLPPKPLA
ncbi:MAG: YjbF family lipoprotein, partial [Elioraea sp.]|nr:YjbF family lipoprotein [Elioraea sp.]